MDGSLKGPLLCGWLIFVIFFIILSCCVPPQLAESGANKLAFYVPMFILICPILAARMGATTIGDNMEPAVMFPVFCCVLLPSLLGCGLTLFGAGEYYSLANGAEGTGSITSVRDLLSARPRPTKFYFNDGYIATSMAATQDFCSKDKHGKTVCSKNSLAPVYQSEGAFLEETTIYAWALPVNQQGEIIASDTCQHESGAQGLCGTMMPYEHIDFGQVVEKFKEDHPKLEFSEDLPFIMFTDPAKSESALKDTMIAGIVLLCIAMFITLGEAYMSFKEDGGFRTRSIADKLLDNAVEQEDSEDAEAASHELLVEE